jgi:predicted PurR-regulated permease PerM
VSEIGRAEAAERPSFGWTVLTLGAVGIVLGAIHLAASIATPILLAVVLALIFAPLVAWLVRRGLPRWGALVVFFVGILASLVALAVLLRSSAAQLSARLDTYTANWSAQLQTLDATLDSYGLSDFDLAAVLPPQAFVDVFTFILGALVGVLSQVVFILILLVFLLAEGPAMINRLRASLGNDAPRVVRLVAYGHDVGRYFALRALINAVTGVAVTIVLALLGVDLPVLWGVLTFFLSFIPYVGMFIASVPSVLLAWAEFGVAHALVVVIALTLANALAENFVQPALMDRGLHLSPTLVFLSVVFWSWLLEGGGSFLAVPLSVGVVALLNSFPTTRWLAAAVTTRTETNVEPVAAPTDSNGSALASAPKDAAAMLSGQPPSASSQAPAGRN